MNLPMTVSLLKGTVYRPERLRLCYKSQPIEGTRLLFPKMQPVFKVFQRSTLVVPG